MKSCLPHFRYSTRRKLRRLLSTPTFYVRTWWAWLPQACRWVVRLNPTSNPILITSLPRSGSTWCLHVIGEAEETLPAYEPILNALKRYDRNWCWFSREPDDKVDYPTFCYNCFTGIPKGPSELYLAWHRWGIWSRQGRRPLVKETLLRSMPQCIKTYSPTVVMLRRHPAAVAESLIRSNVLSSIRLANAQRKPVFARLFEGVPIYQALGRLQGYLLSEFLSQCSHYEKLLIVSHEQLCTAPIPEFQKIFAHCGLKWSARIERKLARLSEVESPYPGTPQRITSTLPSRIGAGLTTQEITQVRKGWDEYGLPWYRLDEEWPKKSIKPEGL